MDPSIGTLGIGEAMEVTVEFHPPKTGVYSSPMIVHYDTGKCMVQLLSVFPNRAVSTLSVII